MCPRLLCLSRLLLLCSCSLSLASSCLSRINHFTSYTPYLTSPVLIPLLPSFLIPLYSYLLLTLSSFLSCSFCPHSSLFSIFLPPLSSPSFLSPPLIFLFLFFLSTPSLYSLYIGFSYLFSVRLTLLPSPCSTPLVFSINIILISFLFFSSFFLILSTPPSIFFPFLSSSFSCSLFLFIFFDSLTSRLFLCKAPI
uniref:Hypothetical secreted protein n=1 Tax=Triatoma matogrossensis TaxID=162370 RepID=E2J7G8_9HEMI